MGRLVQSIAEQDRRQRAPERRAGRPDQFSLADREVAVMARDLADRADKFSPALAVERKQGIETAVEIGDGDVSLRPNVVAHRPIAERGGAGTIRGFAFIGIGVAVLGDDRQ